MNNMEWFIAQSKIAEANLVRLALIAEKHIHSSSEMHDLVNDCLTSSALLREAREAAQQNAHADAGDLSGSVEIIYPGSLSALEDQSTPAPARVA